MIAYEAFKKMFNETPGEPEYEIIFRGNKKTYMIIKYDDHASFQRCGFHDGSGEYEYPSFEELCETKSVDGICLRDMWENIETIIAEARYDLSLPDEVEDFKRFYEGMKQTVGRAANHITDSWLFSFFRKAGIDHDFLYGRLRMPGFHERAAGDRHHAYYAYEEPRKKCDCNIPLM